MSDKRSNGSNRESLDLRNWSISPTPSLNNNVFVNGRNAIEENYPFFVGNVAEGNIARNNAEAELVLNGQLLDRNNQMVGFTRARKLRPRWVTHRPQHEHYVALQQTDAMEEGTICMIDKNGACVPIGQTDPRYTTRTTESMRREYQEIMNDPASILPDIQRAQQLLRMIHTREAQEYLERERLRREREREQSFFRIVQNGTRRIRNGALSGVRGLFSRANQRRSRSPGRRSRTPGGTRRS